MGIWWSFTHFCPNSCFNSNATLSFWFISAASASVFLLSRKSLALSVNTQFWLEKLRKQRCRWRLEHHRGRRWRRFLVFFDPICIRAGVFDRLGSRRKVLISWFWRRGNYGFFPKSFSWFFFKPIWSRARAEFDLGRF